MSTLNKTLFLGAFLLVVFSGNVAFATTTPLYWQLDYSFEKLNISSFGEQLQPYYTCGLTGFPTTLSVIVRTNQVVSLTAEVKNPSIPYAEWYFLPQNVNTNGAFQVISFDISSTTKPIDLSICDPNWQQNWYWYISNSYGDYPDRFFSAFGTDETQYYPEIKTLLTAFRVGGGENPTFPKDWYYILSGTGTTTPIIPPISYDCSTYGTIGGAFCNALMALFYPSATSLNQFSNLKDIIAQKPPFGYWTSIKGYLNTLTATGTPVFSLTSELQNISIFATLKTGLTWLLWLIFGVWVIKRIARFDF